MLKPTITLSWQRCIYQDTLESACAPCWSFSAAQVIYELSILRTPYCETFSNAVKPW